MDYREITLANNIRVIYKVLRESHSVTAGIWINVGSRYEDAKESGISHFLEHLLFKGTEKRSCFELKQAIEGVGGSFNGFTSEEVTCYWIKILGRYLDLSIDILADMVRAPRLRPADLAKEKSVIMEEISMYKDVPARYVHELFDELLFAPHPLGRPVVGTSETVTALTRADVREFLTARYAPENIVISVCGRFDENELKRLCDRYLGDMKQGRRNVFNRWENPVDRGGAVKIFPKDTEQVHFCLGGYGVSLFNKKRYPLSVLNLILGGNMTSRLFDEIREKRALAYDIRSYSKHYQDTGAFVVSAGVAPAKTEEALKVTLAQIAKI